MNLLTYLSANLLVSCPLYLAYRDMNLNPSVFGSSIAALPPNKQGAVGIHVGVN